MKRSGIIIIFFFIACNHSETSDKTISSDTVSHTSLTPQVKTKTGNFWDDTYNLHRNPVTDSIGGKPVSWYLNNPQVNDLAKAFYNGQFRPIDNDSTTRLLSLAVTNNNELRPFYRWCLDATIDIADGALGEYPGQPAMEYATKFPAEFFDYMDKDSSGERYKNWIEIIAYSGIKNYNETPKIIGKEIEDKMTANCKDCTIGLKNRINKFAADVAGALKD